MWAGRSTLQLPQGQVGQTGVAQLESGDLDSLCRLYTESYILYPTQKRLACHSTALMVGLSLLASHAFSTLEGDKNIGTPSLKPNFIKLPITSASKQRQTC